MLKTLLKDSEFRKQTILHSSIFIELSPAAVKINEEKLLLFLKNEKGNWFLK